MCLAIPGLVQTVEESTENVMRAGKVSFSGIVKEVNLSMVPEAQIGDYVLVHVGVAISKIDEAEAQKTLNYLKEMGDMDELEV